MGSNRKGGPTAKNFSVMTVARNFSKFVKQTGPADLRILYANL